jgi:DNA-binding response OmpR family regulator
MERLPRGLPSRPWKLATWIFGDKPVQANEKQRVNLEKCAVLLLEDSPLALDILVQVLTGFGIKDFRKCTNVDEAKAAAADAPLDLMMVAAALPGEDGYDFVRWLRRAKLQPNSFCPVIMLTGHTQQSKVAKARDCGANFIIAKPLTTSVVLERICWV